MGLGLCTRGRKAKESIALVVNRANALIVLVTCLDTVGLLPADSSGKFHGLCLA